MLHPNRFTLACLFSGATSLAACNETVTKESAPTTTPAASGGEAPGGSEEPNADGSTPPTRRSPLVTARPYDVKKSSKYDGSAPVPLVLSLHGYTGTAKIHESYFKLAAVAERKNFLVALPDGKQDSGGSQFWNASDACCDFYSDGVDDVAYLKAVIGDMKARFKVDPKRVYVVGHSNGGFMAHRLACEMAGEIAAIVSLAGVSWSDASKCKPSEPVSVLQVHGDADETVEYGGGTFFAGSPAYPSAKATVAMWAQKNGCSAELTTVADKLDLDVSKAGAETTVARHACAATAGAAELWTIAGGKHIPSFDDAWAETLYGFLEAHAKP